MKAALYARVSTADKDQDPETQLVQLRDSCRARGWEICNEYVDRASAIDLAHRTAWRQLLDDATKRKFGVVLVFKLDRAFHSVKHMHDTLYVWEALGIGFTSLREQFDTSTAVGRVLLNLLAAVAEFEREQIRERVTSGTDRAGRQGKRIGRPMVVDRKGFNSRYKTIMERLSMEDISRRRAAKELGIGYATLKRLLDANYFPE